MIVKLRRCIILIKKNKREPCVCTHMAKPHVYFAGLKIFESVSISNGLIGYLSYFHYYDLIACEIWKWNGVHQTDLNLLLNQNLQMLFTETELYITIGCMDKPMMYMQPATNNLILLPCALHTFFKIISFVKTHPTLLLYRKISFQVSTECSTHLVMG